MMIIVPSSHLARKNRFLEYTGNKGFKLIPKSV
jgi:hypothetical protein